MDENEQEEKVEETEYRENKDALLICIDVSYSTTKTQLIHSKQGEEDRKSIVLSALETVYDIYTHRIISSPKDYIGVLLYGTKFTTDTKFQNCNLLLPLDVPTVKSIKLLQNLISDNEILKKTCEYNPDFYSLSDVLVYANHLLSDKFKNTWIKRLILITDNDNPYKNYPQNMQVAVTRAKDLFYSDILIFPIFVSNNSSSFDTSKFYDSIFFHKKDSKNSYFNKKTDPPTTLENLKSAIVNKETPQRADFHSNLEIAPGVFIGIKGFSLYKKAELEKLQYVYYDKDEPHIVETTTIHISEASGRSLEKEDLCRGFKFSDNDPPVLFEKEELETLRNFDDPVIRIIGFLDAKKLSYKYNMSCAKFLFPSDKYISGSIKTFTALYKVLLEDKKIAIAYTIIRKGSQPRYTALVPSQRSKNEAANDETPTGLFMIFLPFMDDMRDDPKLALFYPADNQIVKAMEKIIKTLTMPAGFDYRRYTNPNLQWQYKLLKAKALDEDMPDKDIFLTEDKSLPKYNSILKRAGNDINHWIKLYNSADIRNPSSKRVKLENLNIPDDKVVYDLYDSDRLMDLTFQQLKLWADTKGIIPKIKKKANYVTSITNYFAQEKK